MKDEKLPITWVNTPLSYAKLTTKYSLFQQSVLLKVSEFLQRQMELYYGSDMKNNPDVPRPLFTEEQKSMGLGKIYVSYAELGVAASSFPKVREEAQKCLRDMVVAGPVVLKEGKPTQSFYPVFTEIHVDHSNSTCSFELNTAFIDSDKHKERVIDYTFDMSQRYVKHPDNIAIVGKVEKMPGLYFLLRDTMQSWKYKKQKLTVSQIKDFLNMYKTDKDGNQIPMYPKFSQFKKYVLEPAIADMQRLKDVGQIDVSFTMDCVYNGKRAVGDPAYIVFSIVEEKKKQEKPKAIQQSLFVDEPQKSKYVIETQEEKNERIWQSFLLHYKGKGREVLSRMRYEGITPGKQIVLGCTKEDADTFEGIISTMEIEEKRELITRWSKHTGVKLKGMEYNTIRD